MQIAELLEDEISIDQVSKFFDELHQQGRIETTRSLTKRQLALLYDAAEGHMKLDVQTLVPPAIAPLQQVIHWGANSLPVYRTFKKRFCRPPIYHVQNDTEIWGYNDQTFRPVTGPGYFVARNMETNEIDIDYSDVPPMRVPGWPRVRKNERGLSRFVFGRMRDHLRGVTNQVTIGRAIRNQKATDIWFVLVRDDLRGEYPKSI